MTNEQVTRKSVRKDSSIKRKVVLPLLAEIEDVD